MQSDEKLYSQGGSQQNNRLQSFDEEDEFQEPAI